MGGKAAAAIRELVTAKLKGGNIYTAPEIIIPFGEDGNPVTPEPQGVSLRPVDIEAMVESNREMLEIIEQTTVKKILAIFTKYKNRVDCFYVAFSGGKDSCILLDLVKKALPRGSFVVIFGDTGMEFPDTYEVIKKTKQQCAEDGIPFYIARSHLDPKDSWKLFGPPSRVLRWCCSVHKSAPQTLKMREITGKDDYTGLAFVGVRSHESAKRAEYEYENYGRKQRGQYSHNSILEWTSSEVWLYIYANHILINEAYQKGNSRAGCIFCPMSVKKADYIKHELYPYEMEMYLDLIRNINGRNFGQDTYLTEGGWVSRRSGRDLINNDINYSETIKNGFLTIEVTAPKTDWHEWIKTLGGFGEIPYSVKLKKNGYMVQLPEKFIRENPVIGKFFKQVFRKSAYYVKCGVCEANCILGHLKFDGSLRITDCEYCLKCHDLENGCLAYDSLKIPKRRKQCLLTVLTRTTEKNGLVQLCFFCEKNNFWNEHGLESQSN